MQTRHYQSPSSNTSGGHGRNSLRGSLTTPHRRPLISLNELASWLGVSRDTAYRLVSDRAIRFMKIRGQLRFRPEDVEAFLDRIAEGEPSDDATTHAE